MVVIYLNNYFLLNLYYLYTLKIQTTVLQNINLELEKIILKNGWGFDWFEYTKLESYEKHITVKTFSYPYHTIFSTNLCKSLPEIPVTTVVWIFNVYR